MPRVKTVTLYWHYGDTFDDLRVTWVDEDNLPINLTGYTATMKIKETPGGTAKLTLSSPTGGISIPTPANGQIVFGATPTQMTAGTLVAGISYLYDLQVASGSDKKTLLRGSFIVDQEITDG